MAESDHHSSQDYPVPSCCNNIHREAVHCYYGTSPRGGIINLRYVSHISSRPGLRPTQISRPCTPKSVYSPGHKTYLDRHGVWVQHENPDRTIVEEKFGGAGTGTRSRYPSVRHGLPEVRDTGNIILFFWTDGLFLISTWIWQPEFTGIGMPNTDTVQCGRSTDSRGRSGLAMASASLTTRHWIVKHTSGICGTGK
jgi:hypothetical protein